MGWFSKEPDVPNTIDDDKMRDIQRRATREEAKKNPFSREQVDKRLAGRRQYDQRRWS